MCRAIMLNDPEDWNQYERMAKRRYSKCAAPYDAPIRTKIRWTWKSFGDVQPLSVANKRSILWWKEAHDLFRM